MDSRKKTTENMPPTDSEIWPGTDRGGAPTAGGGAGRPSAQGAVHHQSQGVSQGAPGSSGGGPKLRPTDKVDESMTKNHS